MALAQWQERVFEAHRRHIYPSKLCYMPTTSWSSSRSGLINLMCLVRLSLSIQLSIDQISTISSIQQTEALCHHRRNWDAIDPTVPSWACVAVKGKNSWLVSHKLERRWQAGNSTSLIWFWSQKLTRKFCSKLLLSCNWRNNTSVKHSCTTGQLLSSTWEWCALLQQSYFLHNIVR